MDNSPDSRKVRGYSVSIVIIVIGIIALITAAAISIMKSINVTLLICEAVVLVCLIGALVAVVLAKKHIENQEQKIRLNPYATVDKKEIDKILDMISREEVRRKKSEDFASGIERRDSSTSSTSAASEGAVEDAPEEEDELRFLVIDDHEDDIELPAPVPVVLPDAEPEDTSDDNSISADAESVDNSSNIEGEEEDDMNRGYGDYDDRAPRRRSQDGADRRERDPYYDDYYDERPRQRASRDMRDARDQRDMRDSRDPYASRDREGVYYNEYGEPVRRRRPSAYDPYYDDYYAERPRQRASRDMRDVRDQRDMRGSRDPYASRDREGVYYNEYGEPVRRRRPAAAPYDDRRQAPPRRRRPDGYPDSRPQMRYEDEDIRRSSPAAPAAPAASSAIDDSIDVIGIPAPAESVKPKAPDYDESYVPVVIPDDDYDYDAARSSHTGRAGVGSLNRPEIPHDEPPAYRSEPARGDDRRYSGYDDDERMPIALPDDNYFENRYTSAERDEPYQRDSYRQAPPAAPAAKSDAPTRTRDRYVPDYEEEEMVVSLPRDDEYESYVEKKREEEELAEQQRLKEQRKAERMASGKIVLTIVKIRRRKIRRKSRKYKNFRASVHHLNEYLHSFSSHGGKN